MKEGFEKIEKMVRKNVAYLGSITQIINLDDVLPVDKMDFDYQNIIIFDDGVTDSNLSITRLSSVAKKPFDSQGQMFGHRLLDLLPS